jgi:hypothetical protein
MENKDYLLNDLLIIIFMFFDSGDINVAYYLVHEWALWMTCNGCGASLGHTLLQTFISGFELWIAIEVMQSSPQLHAFSST